jgi:hypothetical protein
MDRPLGQSNRAFARELERRVKMATRKWIIGQPRFYKDVKKEQGSENISVSEADYLGELPPLTVISIPLNQRKFIDKLGALWSEIMYRNSEGEEVLGWVKDGFLEDVAENPRFKEAEVLIPHPSKDPNDAAQNLMWDSEHVVKRNMCSELSVAFIVGDDIETLLRKWEAFDKLFYPSLVKGNRDNPLVDIHIDKILEAYGYPKTNLKYKDGLTDRGIGFVPTPGRFKKMLETCYLIANVRIDSSGKLVSKEDGQGVGHWVVVDKITPYGVGRGRVEIYNPYPNKREEYSFADFLRSCAPSYSGRWVIRSLPSRGVESVIHM